MKKLISVLLCLALCCGALAMTASAAGTYYVAGAHVVNNDHSDPGPFGEAWNNAYPANAMSFQGNGIYEKTYYSVPAGEYQFKITDGTWDNCWPSNNYVLKLDSEKNVTITFNSNTNEVGVSTSSASESPEVTAPEIVTMAIRGEGLDVLNAWASDVIMEEITEGFYEFTFENVSNTTLKIKFAANGNWDDYNFGGSYQGTGITSDAVWFGEDIAVEVGENANVCVQLDLTNLNYASKQGATFAIHVEKAAVEDPTEEPAGDDATEPEEMPSTDAPGNEEPKPANNGMGWIIAVIVIVVLAGGGIAAFLIIRKKKQ